MMNLQINNSSFLFCLLLTVLLMGCERKKTVVDEGNFQKIALKATPITWDEGPKAPQFINIVDSTIMVIHAFSSPKLSFYHKNTLQLINEITNDVSYPSKFLKNVGYYDQSVKVDDATTVTLVDRSNYRFLKYSLSDLLTQTKPIPQDTTYLPKEFILRFNSIIGHNEKVLGTYQGEDSQKGRIFTHNIFSSETKWSPFFPDSETTKFPKDLAYYYYSYCSFNLERENMASAMKFFKRVDFFNFDGELESSYVFKPFDRDTSVYKPNIIGSENTILYYNESFAGKKNFYATCINRPAKDYTTNKGQMELHKFSWDGKLEKIYKLDRMYLGDFCVDEETGKVYVINYCSDNEASPVLLYKLI